MATSPALKLAPLPHVSKFSWVAIGLFAAHLFVVIVTQGQPLEPLSSWLLLFAIALFASICCFRTSRRAASHYRTFWILAGCSFAFWSAGQLLDIVNEFYLGSPDPNPSALLFVYFAAMAPLALGIFRVTRRRDETAWIWFLDGVQVLGIILAGILFTYLAGNVNHGLQTAEDRLQILHLRNLVLTVALIVRSVIARSHASRRLYAPLAAAFSSYTMSSWLGNHAQELWGLPTGGWSDLTWSVPFAIVAMAAAEWRSGDDAEPGVVLGPNTRFAAHLLTDYILPILLPAAVMVSAYLMVPQEPVVAPALIVTSFGCFVARLCVTQCHRDRLIRDLKKTVNKVRVLSGLLPICAGCKMIRDENGGWHNLESYIRANSEADFTHGICPGCVQRLYPDHSPAHSD